MQCTTNWRQKQVRRWLGSRLHSLAVVSLVLVALVGHPLEVSVGWVVCPPQVIELPGGVGRPRQGRTEFDPGLAGPTGSRPGYGLWRGVSCWR
jgi:hypothetical protein